MKARVFPMLLPALLVSTMALAQDDWDVDHSDAPPAAEPHWLVKPVVFAEPNTLVFSCDTHKVPIISIAPNQKTSIPVFYSLKVKDTVVSIQLFTRPLRSHRRPSLFQPPKKGNAFTIRVSYKEDPVDVGVFLVTRPAVDSAWTIQAVHETGFIVLQSVSEKKLTVVPRKE